MVEKFAAKKHTTSNPSDPPSVLPLGNIFVIVNDSEPCYDTAREKRTGSKIRYRFQLPEIPRGCWCDFRRDFESGMTLKSIGIKYHCDQRTVRSCIILNKSSSELGHQYAPTKLEPYIPEIERLYQILSSGGTPQSAEQNTPQKADSSPGQFTAQEVQIQHLDLSPHQHIRQKTGSQFKDSGPQQLTQQKTQAKYADSFSNKAIQQESKTTPSVIPGITRLSRLIAQKIAEFGYTGSERLVRNYLRAKCLQSKDNWQGQSSERVKEQNTHPIRRTDNKESKRA